MNTPRTLFAMVGTLVSLALPPTVAAQVPAKAPAGKSIPAPAPPADLPVITIFNALPATLVQGDALNFSWMAIPGPGGSPITRVTLTADGVPLPIASGVNTFTCTYTWVGPKTFTLTAYNATGSSSKVRPIQGISIAEAMRNLIISNMEADPTRFGVGQSIDFKVLISNGNAGRTLYDANIFVTQGSRVVGNLTATAITPGGSVKTMRDSGFVATGGTYTVDVEYKGQHKTKNFATKPVTMYTLDPVP